MRFLVGMLASVMRTRRQRRNLRLLGWLLLAFLGLLAAFSLTFHWLMAREGQHHSWVTSVYWTFVTMSTLGFGDITFHSDAGRLFTIVVLLSGTVFLLILLPFTFIQFFFTPWMEAQEAALLPRSLPPRTSGHVLLTRVGPVEEALVKLLEAAGIPAWVIAADSAEATPLLDAGYRVMVGPLDDPDTYRAARVDQAALVATTQGDMLNTNVAFTVRETGGTLPIVATASSDTAVDILEMAGCDRVLRLGKMLGEALARRVLGRDGRPRVVGEFDDLVIAEAGVAGTDLVGRTLAGSRLREEAGLNAVGLWQRGVFELARPEAMLEPASVLVLAGSPKQLARYAELHARPESPAGLTVIIGSGRVGRAVAATLAAEGFDYRLVERDASRLREPARGVVGDAADHEVLEQAGIRACSSIVITTHDDDVNIYLTLYCRRLRPDVQILARSTRDRNISTLHRAGADVVMSYASTGATAISNLLERVDILLVAEGLHVFRLDTPPALVGRCLAESGIRATTGCTVIAVGGGDHFDPAPDALTPLAAGSELVLVGGGDAETRFIERFGKRG
jgi:Trk K+ transport system NAD-binding subunit